MRTLLNIIWLILSGFWLFLSYALAGVIMCILIITIPFGVQAFKLAKFSLWPFGRTVIEEAFEAGKKATVSSRNIAARPLEQA